ncbi:hypothetical protein SAMN06265346_10529 [Flavobacterium hercynium]|uniref:Uncharacterized protein n=1 Tax=Flavobacterium hercynium TaxID=387094 RepID=A0A226GVN4_9FLAO|nr:hypothetical protein B0A66_19645 [Flavobacterium hercynium]SMP16389.1 hypothetical protein SAMN06265346_10529 [Flavobacterium hercynium]
MKKINYKLVNIFPKITSILIILLINFLILGWDTKNEYYWKFNSRIFKEFVLNYDFYSYLYICTLIFLGEIILFLNVFYNHRRFTKNLNIFGILLIMIGFGWLLSMRFGTPELNYYHVFSIFCLTVIFLTYTIVRKISFSK